MNAIERRTTFISQLLPAFPDGVQRPYVV